MCLHWPLEHLRSAPAGLLTTKYIIIMLRPSLIASIMLMILMTGQCLKEIFHFQCLYITKNLLVIMSMFILLS